MATSLHLNKSAFLIGSAGAGKNTLLRMLARRFCLGQKKESFIFTKHLDPVGVLTQAGMTSDIECFCATDFDPVSQNNVPLSAENWKSVTDPEEGVSGQLDITSPRSRSSVRGCSLSMVQRVSPHLGSTSMIVPHLWHL